MLHRQVYPLLLAHACDSAPIRGRTRFQKMIFMMEQSLKKKGAEGRRGEVAMPDLGFVPFEYGPYSKTLQQDVDELVNANLVHERDGRNQAGKVLYTYTITRNGGRIARKLVADAQYRPYRFGDAHTELERIKSRFNDMDLPDLLRHVYESYPYYASRSKYEIW